MRRKINVLARTHANFHVLSQWLRFRFWMWLVRLTDPAKDHAADRGGVVCPGGCLKNYAHPECDGCELNR